MRYSGYRPLEEYVSSVEFAVQSLDHKSGARLPVVNLPEAIGASAVDFVVRMMAGKDPKGTDVEDPSPQYAVSAAQQHIKIPFLDPGQIIIRVPADQPALRNLESDVKL